MFDRDQIFVWRSVADKTEIYSNVDQLLDVCWISYHKPKEVMMEEIEKDMRERFLWRTTDPNIIEEIRSRLLFLLLQYHHQGYIMPRIISG